VGQPRATHFSYNQSGTNQSTTQSGTATLTSQAIVKFCNSTSRPDVCQTQAGTTTNGRVSGLLYTSSPTPPVNCIEDDANSTSGVIAYGSCPSQYNQGDISNSGNQVVQGLSHSLGSLAQLTANTASVSTGCCTQEMQLAIPARPTAAESIYSFHCGLFWQASATSAKLILGVKSTTSPAN